jgi:formylglycine-generating enzyme required for sulfatase activity
MSKSHFGFLLLLIAIPALQPAAPPVVNDGYGELVFVPAGAFRMGDTFGDGEPRERPAHVVELDAYYIGKYEVTNAQWRKFRDDPGYDDPKFWPGGTPVPKDQDLTGRKPTITGEVRRRAITIRSLE